MIEAQYIWMNGQLIPWAEAKVHVMTHALHYGSSVFEGIRCYATPRGPSIFRLQAHLRRLIESTIPYRMTPPWTREQLTAACFSLIRENGLRSAYLRPLVFRGYAPISVVPAESCPIEMMIAAFEYGAYLGRDALENGIDACVSSWHRTTSGSNPVLAKAGGHYTNAYLIGAEARRNGFGEGISVSAEGQVCEGAASNLFLVRDGAICTPPLSASILGGITRDSVLTLARDLGMKTVEMNLPREMLYLADEVFLTGTAAEITPVRSVDRLPVGGGKPGPVTRQLQAAFFGLFNGDTPDRHGWLELVEPNPASASGPSSASPAVGAV
jgi:branched-chain amino acid aminotransferase